MKTLELRVRQQNISALKLAQALEAHPKVGSAYGSLGLRFFIYKVVKALSPYSGFLVYLVC